LYKNQKKNKNIYYVGKVYLTVENVGANI